MFRGSKVEELRLNMRVSLVTTESSESMRVLELYYESCCGVR